MRFFLLAQQKNIPMSVSDESSESNTRNVMRSEFSTSSPIRILL